MNREQRALSVAALVFACLAVAGAPRAEEQTIFRYMGVKWCRGCHSRQGANPKLGLFHSWEDSAHAKAWERLPEGERTNPECLKCHTTGYGLPWRAGTTAEELRGVQCEACHGPGSHYFTWNVMKNRDLALSRGLVLPNREVCAKCHW